MTKIKNTTAYPYKSPISGNDYLVGSNAENDGQTMNFLVDDLATALTEIISETVAGIDQDNIGLTINLQFTGDTTPDNILSFINALPESTITEKQNIWFRAMEVGVTEPHVFQIRMRNKGKGTYGTGNTQLAVADLEFIGIAPITTPDIIADPNTITIPYGDLPVGGTVYDWLAGEDPAIEIQNQTAGYTLFTGTIDGLLQEYLWIGEEGDYGVGGTEPTSEDFQLINKDLLLNFLTKADVAEKLNTSDLLETDWTAYGLIPTTSFTLTSTIQPGATYLLRRRLYHPGMVKTFTANKDTYIYLNSLEQFVFIETTLGAGDPVTPVGSTLTCRVVTNGTGITLVQDRRTTVVTINRNINVGAGKRLLLGVPNHDGNTQFAVGSAYGYMDFASANPGIGGLQTLQFAHTSGTIVRNVLGYFRIVNVLSEIYFNANGHLTAPQLTIALINAAGAKSLTTKEYVDSVVGGGGGIPLSGTTVGNPLTGTIEADVVSVLARVDSAIIIGVGESLDLENFDRGSKVSFNSAIGYSELYLGVSTNTIANNVTLSIRTNDDLSVNEIILNAPVFSKGFVGNDYYGANYDDNTYIQKKYITNKLNKTVTGTTYTLLESDKDKILLFTNASAITLTIPTGLSADSRFEGKQMGAGQITFSASGTTLLTDPDEDLKTKGINSAFAIDSTTTNEFLIYGKLALL